MRGYRDRDLWQHISPIRHVYTCLKERGELIPKNEDKKVENLMEDPVLGAKGVKALVNNGGRGTG